MILFDEFAELAVSDKFRGFFLVVIQLGSIFAVLVLYHKKLNPFSPAKNDEEKKKTWMLWLKVIVACIPAAIVGILLDDWVEENYYTAVTVAIALIFYGIAFIIVERIKEGGKLPGPLARLAQGRGEPAAKADKSAGSTYKPSSVVGRHSPEALEARASELGVDRLSSALQEPQGSQGDVVPEALQGVRKSVPLTPSKGDAVTSVDELGFGRALGIGAFQCLAVVPGTSRSGSTILGGRILGVSREAATEFSFFLAIPIMFGWSLLKAVRAFVFDDLAISTTEWGILAVGVVVAFVVSVFAIKFLIGYIRKNSFEIFGWYRIALGIIVLLFFAVTGQLFDLQ